MEEAGGCRLELNLDLKGKFIVLSFSRPISPFFAGPWPLLRKALGKQLMA
jgi:hypothetical protein